MKHLAATIARIERNAPGILDELHHELRVKVEAVVAELGGRLVPYCGFRDAEAQARAQASGASNAAWGQSPHNWRPALACDLVLNPAKVAVAPVAADPDWPNLWDETSPEALAAWAALERAAERARLERVDIIVNGERRRDLPHVQLESWRSFIVH